MNVYFLSGMCVNCNVFKKISLPSEFQKIYIEWEIPDKRTTLQEYAQIMAQNIDRDKPFVIVGYSLGGIVMQEMNKFLTPEKNILISSIKNKEEIPLLFKIGKASRILKYFPKKLYVVNKKLSNLFTQLIYKMSIEEIEECVAYTSPEYMKWTTYQITNWEPTTVCENLYHIHGSKDQVFSYKLIKDPKVYTIKGGDHLMIMNKSEEINKILSEILSKTQYK